MYLHSLLLGLLIAVCSVSEVFSNSYPPEFTKTVQEYPNIISESAKCLPIRASYSSQENYICDPDKMLTVEQINSLNARIFDIKNNINKDSYGLCDSDKPRPAIAIALINDMKVGDKKNEELLNYASVFTYYLFDEWKLPTSCSSGSDKIVIFYSKKDGSLYTYAGSQLNKRLSSNNIIRVSVASKPFFSSSIVSGLTYMLEKYKNILTGRDKGFPSRY